MEGDDSAEGERASKRQRPSETAAAAPPPTHASPTESAAPVTQAETSTQGDPPVSSSKASQGPRTVKRSKKQPSFRRIDPLSSTGVAIEMEPGIGRPTDRETRTTSAQVVAGENTGRVEKEGMTALQVSQQGVAATASLDVRVPLRLIAGMPLPCPTPVPRISIVLTLENDSLHAANHGYKSVASTGCVSKGVSAVHGVEGEKVALEVSWSDGLGEACTAMLPLSTEQRDEIHEWAEVGLVAPHSADDASVWAALSPKLRSRLLPAGWASATIKGGPSPPPPQL